MRPAPKSNHAALAVVCPECHHQNIIARSKLRTTGVVMDGPGTYIEERSVTVKCAKCGCTVSAQTKRKAKQAIVIELPEVPGK